MNVHKEDLLIKWLIGCGFSDLVRVIIAVTVTNTMTKSSVGRNGFISLTITCNSLSSKAVRRGTWREGLMQRPWNKLLTD